LQALKKHKFISVLEDQGLVDITSHVDFESLSKAAAHNGLLTAQIITQGEFLTRLGIEKRIQTLSNASPTKRETFVTACERLTHSSEMGNLFKVLAISNKSIILPAFEIAS
jgi:NADH dehydrogenase [ubiquinone] 1 alpha subcomplex assembly factor 7